MGVAQRCRGSACTFWQLVQLSFMIARVIVFQFSTALGYEAVAFQYLRPGSSLPTAFHVMSDTPDDPDAAVLEIFRDNITFVGSFLPNNESTRNEATEGKCLYNEVVPLLGPGQTVTSFSTMFDISMTLSDDTRCSSHTRRVTTPLVQGLVFFMASDKSTQGESGGFLGWLNSTSNSQESTPYNFAVEFDFFQNAQFEDPPGVHVGVNKNSLTSVVTSTVDWSGMSSFAVQNEQIRLSMWVEYDSTSQTLVVFGTRTCGATFQGITRKPDKPLLSTVVDLQDTISPDGMFVGFSGSSVRDSGSYGANVLYTVDLWTFNSDGPTPDLPRNYDGTLKRNRREVEERRRRKILLDTSAVIATVPIVFLLSLAVYLLYRRNTRLVALGKKYEIEKGVLATRGPQNFKYKVLRTATKGFSPQRLLGSGGFGSVYKGSLILNGNEKPTEIAVKRISATSEQGATEFSAEVKIIGRAQHRNLVRLLGWCQERGELLLVYDYMPNGSVDQHLYCKSGDVSAEEPTVLTWSRRLKIVSGVASALSFLHEEWEQRVIHRDVKSSNVMLDGDFNARLGDFGLARVCEHDQSIPRTRVLAGTRGYIAPEYIQTMTATEKTDVYSFGGLVLELATGKRPMMSREDRKRFNEALLVDWVWELYGKEALLDAVDSRLQNAYDRGEMLMFLKIGLLCCHPDPDKRPTMREVIHIWKGLSPAPPLPRCKPIPFAFPSLGTRSSSLLVEQTHTNVRTCPDQCEQDHESMAGNTRPLSHFDSSHGSIVKVVATEYFSDAAPSLEWDREPAPAPLRHRPCNAPSLPF